jgi:hypothetical protein
VFIFSFQSVFSQSTPPPTQRDVNEQDFNQRREALELLKQMNRNPQNKKSKKKPTKEEIKRFKSATSPSEEDLTKYKDFLRQSKTGIFRLLPDFDCESKNSIEVSGDCANFVSGTWIYSFRQENYYGDGLQDIIYKRDTLMTSGLLNQGVLVSLGDLPLEDVSLTSNGIKYLAEFEPAENREDAYEQFEQLTKGIVENDFRYSNHEKVKENTTYALRVVAYRFSDKFIMRERTADNILFFGLENDKRKDLLLAFRIVKKSDDGAITILWKELQDQKSPKLVFKEDKILQDIRISNKN